MSLYEEALVEAKKLRETAEEEAKKAIIEAITPQIKKLTAELTNKPVVLFEEEDKMAADASAPAPTGPVAMDPAPVGGDAVVGGASDAPIKAAGADALNMPMPGPDGKLVIDFDDLFVPAEPGDEEAKGDEGAASAALPPDMPGGMPSPEPVDVVPTPGEGEATPTDPSVAAATDAAAAPSTELDPNPMTPPEEPQMEENPSYELFRESLNKLSTRVNKIYEKKSAPSLMREAVQDKLFEMFESLETLSEKGLVSKQLAKIFEARLEILHLKLKEAFEPNTYITADKGNNMATKSLKEYAKKLLAEASDTVEGGDVKSPADVHKTEVTMKVDNSHEKAADKAGDHAMKVTEPEVTLKTDLAEELSKLDEEIASLTENPGESLAAKEGGQDVAGAASSIPDKKVGQVDTTKGVAGDKTNPASHVLGVKEGKVAVDAKALQEETKSLKAEALKKQIAALQEQLSECEMVPEAVPAPGVPEKKSVMGEDDTTINFNFDLSDLVPALDGMGDDDEIEIVDDGEPMSGGMDLGAPEGGEADKADFSPVSSEPEASDVSDVGDLEDEGDADKDLPLAESVAKGKGPMAQKVLAENKALKAQLSEAKLFNAKVVFMQPFMNNKNLTKEQKQQIVEFLDRGRTVEEVKTIYNKVKMTLENAQKAKARVGSASKPTTPSGASLNESAKPEANLFEGATLEEAARVRLMELAGIKRK